MLLLCLLFVSSAISSVPGTCNYLITEKSIIGRDQEVFDPTETSIIDSDTASDKFSYSN